MYVLLFVIVFVVVYVYVVDECGFVKKVELLLW